MNTSTLKLTVQEALSLEGYLEKAKPESIITYYQKRYCKILKQGPFLAYAEKPEDYEKNKIKGLISIRDMLDAYVLDGSPKRFEVLQEGRAYKFEAKTPDESKKWVNALKTIQNHIMEEDARWVREVGALNPDFTVVETEELNGKHGDVSLFVPAQLLANVVQKVVVEGAVGTAVGIVKKGVKGVGDLVTGQKSGTNEDYLKAKGFHDIVDGIDPKILKSRLKMGMLIREMKEATGLGLVDNIMNDSGMRDQSTVHWCFLISSKPLLASEVDPHDEETLGRGSLPLDVKYDTLYMYDDGCDDSKPVEVFRMKDVEHVVVKKRSYVENIFHFILDMGEKKLNLKTTTFEEMDTWLRAIQTSRTTTAEYKKSTEPTLKNLFWILKIFEGQDGLRKLQDKIEKDYEKLTEGDIEDLTGLIKVQETVANEFIAVVNACLAHRTPKFEIIREYTAVFHESIISSLKSYCKKNVQNLDNKDFFELINFLSWYDARLTSHSPSLEDPRIKEGIRTLSSIAANRILKNPNMSAMANILEFLQKEQPEVDSRGRYATQIPKDVFKILVETLNMLSHCSVEEFTLNLVEACQKTLEYFQNGLEILVEQSDFANDQLAGISNDMMTFVGEVKEFLIVAQNAVPNSSTIGDRFDSGTLCRNFVTVNKKSLHKLAENLCNRQAERFKRDFLQLDFKPFLEAMVEEAEQITSKMHPSYPAKLAAELLKNLVHFYVKLFIDTADLKKFKKEQIPTIQKRLADDQELIIEGFGCFKDLRPQDVDKLLNPIIDIQEFFATGYEQLSLVMISMKDIDGIKMKWPTLEYLIKLRSEEVPKESRGEVMTLCKEVYQNTEKKDSNNKDSNSSKTSLNRMDSMMSEESPTSRSESSYEEGGSPKKLMRGNSSTVSMRLKLEGYLQVEGNILAGMANVISGGGKLVEYFSIRKDKMYSFKDNTSENALDTIDLKQATECIPDKENKNKFHLKVKVDKKDMKEYGFVAENQHKRDLWIKTIQNVMMMSSIQNEREKIEIELELFRDTLPIFNIVESAPALVYEFNKPFKQKNKNQEDMFVLGEPPKKAQQHQDQQPQQSIYQQPSNSSKQTFHDDSEVEVQPKLGFFANLCMRLRFSKPPQSERTGSFYQQSL